jgi:hypothetical protein
MTTAAAAHHYATTDRYTGEVKKDADLAGAGFGIWHVAGLQDLGSGAGRSYHAASIGHSLERR